MWGFPKQLWWLKNRKKEMGAGEGRLMPSLFKENFILAVLLGKTLGHSSCVC